MTDRAHPFTGDQPQTFEFSAENQKKIAHILTKYPAGKQASAILPLLDLAQRQHQGWIPRAAMDHIGKLLNLPPIRVYEVATFYSMFNLEPVGKHVLQICRTTPCWLRGADEVLEACQNHLGIGIGETTPDGLFTIQDVECLGACIHAPVVQINDDYHENLSPESMVELLKTLKASSSGSRKKDT